MTGARGKFQVWAGMFRRAAPPTLPRSTCPLKPAEEASEPQRELGHGVVESGDKVLTK